MTRVGWRYAAVLAALVTGTAIAAAPWAGRPARASAWMPFDDDVATTVAVATNLNSTAVAFVNGKGRVRLRRPPDPGSIDLGQPADGCEVV
jgi:hypothetical protein